MVSLCIPFIKVQCRPMFKSAFFSCANGLLEVSHTVHHAQVKKVECIVKSVCGPVSLCHRHCHCSICAFAGVLQTSCSHVLPYTCMNCIWKMYACTEIHILTQRYYTLCVCYSSPFFMPQYFLETITRVWIYYSFHSS